MPRLVGFAVDAIWELESATLFSALVSGAVASGPGVVGTDVADDEVTTGAEAATDAGEAEATFVGSVRVSFVAGCADVAVEPAVRVGFSAVEAAVPVVGAIVVSFATGCAVVAVEPAVRVGFSAEDAMVPVVGGVTEAVVGTTEVSFADGCADVAAGPAVRVGFSAVEAAVPVVGGVTEAVVGATEVSFAVGCADVAVEPAVRVGFSADDAVIPVAGDDVIVFDVRVRDEFPVGEPATTVVCEEFGDVAGEVRDDLSAAGAAATVTGELDAEVEGRDGLSPDGTVDTLVEAAVTTDEGGADGVVSPFRSPVVFAAVEDSTVGVCAGDVVAFVAGAVIALTVGIRDPAPV